MIIIDQANQDRKQPNLSEILKKYELDDIDYNTLFENGIWCIDLLYKTSPSGN